jgi:cytidylate kinase
MVELRVSVVCLCHGEGTGGEAIGQMLAEQLDFRYVDDEIVVAAADAANAYPEAVSQAEARHPGRWLEVDFNRLELTESVRELIRRAIVATADEGKAVIVAHAASFALTDRESVFRVRVTASTETRVRRLAEADELDDREAAKRLKDSDKNLRAYLKHFYGVGDEQPTDYDLVVNTDRLSTVSAVEAMVHAAAEPR